MADKTSLSRLKQQLQITGLAQKNNSLFQVLNQLVTGLQDVIDDVSNLDTGGGSGTDISNQDFLTSADDSATLPNSRELLAGTGVAFDDSTPNQRTLSVTTGTGFLTGTGNPQGITSAGLGTFYIDTSNGYCYQKVGGSTTAYGWYLIRPGYGAGLGGPIPVAFFVSGVRAATQSPFFNGLGYFMPSSGDTVDAFTGSGITTNSFNYVSGKLFKTIAGAATSGTNTYINSNTTSQRQSLDDDIDIYITLRTGADVTDVRYWFGLTANVITSSDSFGTGSNGALLFRYSTAAGDGGWIGQSCISGAANHSETATIAAIAANTTYKLRLRFIRSGTPTVYFSVNDGTEISLTTNIPPTGSTYFLITGFTTLTNAAKSLGIRSIGGTQGS